MFTKIYGKLNKALNQLHFFTMRTWNLSHGNYDKLLSTLSEEDRRTFPFDLTSIDWKRYIEIFCMGTKKYLLKDNMSNLDRARQHIKRRRRVRYTIDFIMFLLGTYLLYLRSRIAREIWSSVLGMCLNWLSKVRLLHNKS